jgi:hypothetical protein
MLDLYPRVPLDAIVVVTMQRFSAAPVAREQSARERAAKEAAARKAAQGAEMSTLGYAKRPAPSPERSAPLQAWHCQESPPNGKVVCHPIVGYEKR